jgi:hypothetical protein
LVLAGSEFGRLELMVGSEFGRLELMVGSEGIAIKARVTGKELNLVGVEMRLVSIEPKQTKVSELVAVEEESKLGAIGE